jgi:ClpP class serine protease
VKGWPYRIDTTGYSYLAMHRGYGKELFAHPQSMRAGYEQREIDPGCIADGVGVVVIEGELASKHGLWLDDYECILQRFRDTIYSDDVHCVLLKIDSPGGDASGLNETVDAAIECKEETGKPVYAYADEGAYSAAYALACIADEIYLPEPGGVGSIGVISGLMSRRRMLQEAGIDIELVMSGERKGDGNPDAPITEEAIAHVQRRVDQLAGIYWELVARTRGMSVKKVAALQADTFYGAEAVAAGLADDVMSLDEVLRYAKERQYLSLVG